jgi:molecular chaperone DnaK (HSP70)
VIDPIIGIDLGTTNSEVAFVRDGTPQVIAVDGSKLLPSVVGLADDGALLVGQSARNQYVLRPERTVRSIKRRMGQDEKVPMGESAFTPQEISALILRRLKEAAEQHLGTTVTRAVITVPAYFSDAQRQATRDAGKLAGLQVVRIINEPTAAALAYEAAHEGHKNILVYDLGGGTFDVSVVRMEKDVVEVLSSHGNNHLGGDDFDARVVDHLVGWLKQHRGVDPTADRVAMARITRTAESAKIALSDAPYAQKVYQGEDADALGNTEIGSFRIQGLSDVPAGNVIVTTFSLDVNGILHVSSREKRTGREKHVTIENATARFEQEELAAARERLHALIEGVGKGVPGRRETVQSTALLEKAERLLEGAGPDDREDLVNLIETVRDALDTGDAEALERASAELADLIFYLES